MRKKVQNFICKNMIVGEDGVTLLDSYAQKSGNARIHMGL